MKKFSFKAALFILICFGPLVSYNLYMDKFAVFRGDKSGHKSSANQHFIKIKHLLKNKTRYDSYFFGSSKIGRTDLSNIPFGKWYNMSYSQGLPKDHLDDIKIMIKNNIKISYVLIALDIFSYKLDPDEHHNQAMWKPYPEGIYDKIEFYVSYLMLKPKGALFKDHSSKLAFFDHYNTGVLFMPSDDLLIEKNINIHRSGEGFKKGWIYNKNRMDKTLEEIKNTIDICKQNNITIKFIINPEHKATYLGNNIKQYNDFKKKLAQLTDYWDFSGLNTISLDNYYWYETLHYRTIVGQMMNNKIFNINSDRIPKDFGIFVTKESIDAHIKMLNDQLAKYKPSTP